MQPLDTDPSARPLVDFDMLASDQLLYDLHGRLSGFLADALTDWEIKVARELLPKMGAPDPFASLRRNTTVLGKKVGQFVIDGLKQQMTTTITNA